MKIELSFNITNHYNTNNKGLLTNLITLLIVFQLKSALYQLKLILSFYIKILFTISISFKIKLR
jgi:hypothetical protein